jgi:UDP-N-acetylglucosamine--N-acetylmuramyl-(pentapeptide) pyrophosphoryl-undecaprenol N-acetylglucosamine transferase
MGIKMKRIVLTGGGTAGHVTPNIALLPALKREGYEVHYIGSYDGIERKLIEELNIPYYGISSGKLRRYFDPKNFSDPFKVVKGFFEALTLIKKLKPDVVFSKGGFVSVPVVLAAKRKGVPVIIHESDMTPGLANKISIPSAKKVCANFPETVKFLPEGKAVLTGTPIRQELFSGNKLRGLDFCGFSRNKPVLLVVGGSTGSVVVNEAVRAVLPVLLEKFQVVHLCGKDKLDENLIKTPGYVQFEYIKKELSDLLEAADVIISRAGANAICELLALRKPHILIPLSAASSRGDQILNAGSFERQGYSYVLKEEALTKDSLLDAVETVYNKRKTYIEAMSQSKLNNSIETIIQLVKDVSH